MKDISLIVWLTQLGLSVVVPLACFVLLSVWLRNCIGLGDWIVAVGTVLGVISAVSGLVNSLKFLKKFSSDKQNKDLPVSFNEHE